MKKIFLSIISTVVLISSLIFISCSDPVFYYISKDVPSESATINGIIRSIARYTIDDTEYIVTVSSKGIVYKPVAYNEGSNNYSWDESTQEHGTWTKISADELPFTMHYYDYTNAEHHGQQILKVVADEENLYVVTVEYNINSDEGTSCPKAFYIWTVKPTESEKGKWNTLSASNWTEILDENDEIDKTAAIYEYGDYTYTGINVFSTNSAQKSERKVVLRIGNGSSYSIDKDGNSTITYYEISNETINSSAFTISADEILDSDSAGDSVNVNGIAILDGTTYYATTQSLTTNATFETQATAMYWGNGSSLYYQLSGGEATKSVDASYTITSLAICEDAIIIGRGQNSSSYLSSSGGVEKVQFTTESGEYTNIPESSLGTFETNAQTQLLSSYLVQTMFNSTPGKAELDSALYASLYFIGSGSSTSVSYNNIGLWSYYPSRGNWNRE